MSEKTRAALGAATAAYQAAQQEAALTGQDPAAVDPSAYVAAARAHVKDLDPGYLDREGGKPFHDRIVAPALKAEYDGVLEAWSAGDTTLAAKVTALGNEYAAVRQAARVVDGRPAGAPGPAGDAQEG